MAIKKPLWVLFKSVVTVIFLIILFVALLRLQGLQYFSAYLGAGFARELPKNPPSSLNCRAAPIQVVSFNVMYGSAFIEKMAKHFRNGSTGPGELPWSQRLTEIKNRIQEYSPDLLGLQEMDADEDIYAVVPREKYTLVSYHFGAMHYGDSALLFKTDRFEQLDSGQLWLGPTPELPFSLGYRALSMIRYVNWVLLRDKTSDMVFFYANTHFDNAGANKEPSASLFRDTIAAETAFFPTIVTGDFNTTAKEERYRRLTGSNLPAPLLQNAFDLQANAQIPEGLQPNSRIDHILVGGPCHIASEQWGIDIRPLKNGLPMSDHDLVFAKLTFSPKQPEQTKPGKNR